MPGGAEVVFVCQYEAGKLMHEEALSTQDLELIFGPGKVRAGCGAGLLLGIGEAGCGAGLLLGGWSAGSLLACQSLLLGIYAQA